VVSLFLAGNCVFPNRRAVPVEEVAQAARDIDPRWVVVVLVQNDDFPSQRHQTKALRQLKDAPNQILADGEDFLAAQKGVLEADNPAVDNLVVDNLAVDSPVVDNLAVDGPVVDNLAVDSHVVDSPVVDSPAGDDLVLDKAVEDTPAADSLEEDVPEVDILDSILARDSNQEVDILAVHKRAEDTQVDDIQVKGIPGRSVPQKQAPGASHPEKLLVLAVRYVPDPSNPPPLPYQSVGQLTPQFRNLLTHLSMSHDY
jgi:hypothetical protein